MAAYLARIRKTIADGESLVLQSELRIAETDRMLASQGLTREQVMQMRLSDAQKEAVNAELKRRSMDPLEKWSGGNAAGLYGDDELYDHQVFEQPSHLDGSVDELAERQRKFGMMMKPFQI